MMEVLFGTEQLVNWQDVSRLLVRLAIDLTFTAVAVSGVYRRAYSNRAFVFTYYLFNLVTFLLCLLLRKVDAEVGFALALFGIFGILRYRTEQIRIRDLTYLFVVIGVGVLNAVASDKVSLVELLLVNVFVVGTVAVLQLRRGDGPEASIPMIYDRLELLHPTRRPELRADLERRTGLDVIDIEIENLDMLHDSATLIVHHRGSSSRPGP